MPPRRRLKMKQLQLKRKQRAKQQQPRRRPLTRLPPRRLKKKRARKRLILLNLLSLGSQIMLKNLPRTVAKMAKTDPASVISQNLSLPLLISRPNWVARSE